MNLHVVFGKYDRSSLRFLALLFLLLALLVSPKLASAQLSGSDSSGYVNAPLIGKATPADLQAEKIVYLRRALKPTLADIMPVRVNPDLAAPRGAQLARVGEDAPSATTASVVTSTEQTIDLTLQNYTVNTNPGQTTSGYPTGATPNNTDVTWSHDENYIIFSSNIGPGTNYHLYAMSSGGGVLYYNGNTPVYAEQLTFGSNDERYPSLLGPNDNSIAYCTDEYSSSGDYQLVIAPLSLSNTSEPVNQSAAQRLGITTIQGGPGYIFARHPFYAGDIIVVSGATSATNPVWDIWEVSTATGDATQISGSTTDPTGYDNDNPNLSANGQLVWDTTAAGFTYTTGGSPPLNATVANAYRNIVVSSVSGAGEEALTTPSSFNNEHPVWSTSAANSLTATGDLDLFFDSDRTAPFPSGNTVAAKSIYYYPAYSGGGLVTESTAIGASEEAEVDTSNTTTAGMDDGFNNSQPSLSSLQPPYVSVAYISNRYLIDSISDNPLQNTYLSDPSLQSGAITAGAQDTEPQSVATSPTTSSEVMVSRLMVVDPPSLITFNSSSNEIVHVFAGDVSTPASNYSNSLSTVTHYVPAGQDATFVVRLSDRQVGVGAAWLQIKDPNSAYQNASGLEHKVFSQQYGNGFHDQLNEATLFGLYEANILDTLSLGGWDGNNEIEIGNQIETPSTAANPTPETNLEAATAAKATSLPVNSLGNLIAGDVIVINYGGNTEEATRVSATTAATVTTPASLGVSSLTYAHAAGETVELLGQSGTNVAAETTSAALQTTNGARYYTIPLSANLQPTPQGAPPSTTPIFSVGDVIRITSTPGSGGEVAQITEINGTTLTVDENLPVSPPNGIDNEGLSGSYAAGTVVETVGTTQFDPLGSEIDCEAIDTSQQANSSSTGLDTESSNPADFYIPYYLPGSYTVQEVGIAAVNDYSDAGSFPGPQSYWLPLQPLPSTLQDSNGGVLYSAHWNTPLTGSDYYIDVIAEDASGATSNGSQADDQGQNWRIYDNVWGFTTLPFQASHNILVVNDYCLPQKFFSRGGNENSPLHVFGTESYWTDINTDVNDWVNYYEGMSSLTAAPTVVAPLIAQESSLLGLVERAKIAFGFSTEDYANTTLINAQSYNYNFPTYENGLGVNSYVDDLNSQITTLGAAGQTNENSIEAGSQEYDIWRILSRGPVPANVLNSYGAQTVAEPAIPGITTPNNVVVAPSCVVWLSPYSGDALVGPGTITDAATQANLTAFLSTGGRLHIEGKNIGYALTQDGSVINNFYNQYLNNNSSTTTQTFLADDLGNATPVSDLVGAAGQANLISQDAFVNNVYNGQDQNGNIYHTNFLYPIPAPLPGDYSWQYLPPSSTAFGATNILTISHMPQSTYDTSGRTDGALDCTAVSGQTFINGFNTDAIPQLTGVGTDGYHDYEAFYHNTTTGSIVSYSSFGMAEMSQQVVNAANAPISATVPNYYVLNQRSNLMHNIVCALRTGVITGVVSSTGNSAQPIAGVTVIAIAASNGGYASAKEYTGLSNGSGQYQILGVPPGGYVISGQKNGYSYSQHGAQIVNAPVVHGGDSAVYNFGLTAAPNGTLTVLVENSNGAFLNGATVSAVPATSGTSPPSVTTNTQGSATFPSIAVGYYTVTASDPGYQSNSQALVQVPQPTGAATPVIVLSPANVTVSGLTFVNGTHATGALSALTPLASTTLPITAVGAFRPNDVVGIDLGTANAEYVTVTNIDAGPSLSLQSATQYPHGSGAVIDGGIPAADVPLTICTAIGTPIVPLSNPSAFDTTSGANGVYNFTFSTTSVPANVTALYVEYNNPTNAPSNYESVPGNVAISAGSLTASDDFTAVDVPLVSLEPVPTASPGVLVSAGTYPSASTVLVTLSDALTNAQIYYTLTPLGSTVINPPSIASTPFVSGIPIQITSSEILAAIAYDPTNNNEPSNVVEYSYSIGQQVPTPTILPAGGSFTTPPSVTIGDSLSGSTIYYTTNGTTPTTSSTPYTGPFTVNQDESVFAIAVATGYVQSNVAEELFTLILPSAAPTFTPRGSTFIGSVSVSIADTSPGTQIYYTTDGSSPGTGSTPGATATLYNGPINVTSTETITAAAVGGIYVFGPSAAQTYTITPQTPAPSISPNGGTYSTAQTVTITDPQAGAVIYYTTDGSTPTTSSKVYSAPFVISTSTTVNAIAVYSADSASGVTSAVFNLNVTLPSPTISPNGGSFTSPQTVTITDGNSAATIYYSTNANSSSPTWNQYRAPLTVSANETLSALAAGTGYTSSGQVNAVFSFSQAVVASFGAGLQMISLPYSYPGVSLDTIFGYTGVVAAVWQPTAGSYAITPTAPANSIVLGQGYWIRFPSAVNVTVTGTPAPTNAPFVIDLQAGWNMIGDPFNSSVSITSLTFANGSETYSQASSGNSPLIDPTFYSYTNGASTYTSATSLNVDQGYWVYAYSATTMNVPVP
jgi:hypothetical protein